MDVDGQDLPVEQVIPALVLEPGPHVLVEEGDVLPVPGGAHDEVGGQHGAVAEFRVRGPSVASSRATVRSRCTRIVPSATPSKNPSVASPIAPRTMSSICPRGTSPSRPARTAAHGADGREQPAAHPVARTVQELLEAPQPHVPEQRLAHAGEQQHLEVQDFPACRGTFHSICRAITSVLAATLPPRRRTRTCRSRRPARACRGRPRRRGTRGRGAGRRPRRTPPARVVGQRGSQNTPLATTSRS